MPANQYTYGLHQRRPSGSRLIPGPGNTRREERAKRNHVMAEVNRAKLIGGRDCFCEEFKTSRSPAYRTAGY